MEKYFIVFTGMATGYAERLLENVEIKEVHLRLPDLHWSVRG